MMVDSNVTLALASLTLTAKHEVFAPAVTLNNNIMSI
jgi:hypothetical protein